MHYYFSSSYPAVIKFNGVYFGTIHETVKSCRLEDKPFIEICPLVESEKPISFILDNDFLSSPPALCSVTDLKGGYLLKFNPCFNTAEFSVYSQEKYNDAVVTVFSENGYKISIETPNDFYAQSLQFKFDSAKIERFEYLDSVVFITLTGEIKQILAYRLNGKITEIFRQTVESVNIGKTVTTVERLNDMAKHVVSVEWEYENKIFVAKNKKVSCSKNFDRESLPEKLIPYAFLEEFLAGGDYEFYLGGSVKENCDKLLGFFANPIGIMPPPVFRDIDEIGLIYAKSQRQYQVEYYKFSLQDKKIINLTKA